ncbi:MAG TPA: alpha/beta fold hydrolase [Miltoncostaeaceae bacterium]|nr:alpha/beta fold hydrolase [Miltoncostaeaceae bacterium]
MRSLLALLPLALLAALGCSSGDDPGGTGGGGGGTGGGGTGGGGGEVPPIGGDRPVEVFVPSGYQEGTPTPLVILLHGYTASGLVQELLFQVRPVAEARGFLYAHPDGTFDAQGNRFWSATDACCNFYGSAVDDSAYLRRVVEEIQARFTVDPKRIYFLGHSNGAFMSFRMACDHADLIAAVAGLAGAMPADAADCAPSEPVAAAQIHGTADATILYDGGSLNEVPYPGALASAARWAEIGGCGATPTAGQAMDLDGSVMGAETSTQVFGGCDPGGGAELWTIEGGGHVPGLTTAFAPAVLDFLFAHPKP